MCRGHLHEGVDPLGDLDHGRRFQSVRSSNMANAQLGDVFANAEPAHERSGGSPELAQVHLPTLASGTMQCTSA